MKTLLVAIAIAATCGVAGADQGTTARHLLAGVRAFKDARYEEALVELRIVAKAPDAPADLAFYLGPTLVKLGRHRDAIAVFVASKAPRDALSDFYLGEAYYQLKLYRKARAVFADLRSRGLGPVLDQAAARYVDAVDAVFRTSPPATTIDYYIAAGTEDSDPIVAGELFDEARQIEALAPARHRRGEILAGLGAAWNATGRAPAVIEVLGAEPVQGEASWQLARAYTTVGDGAHARPLLDAIARARGAHASEAATLSAKLPP